MFGGYGTEEGEGTRLLICTHLLKIGKKIVKRELPMVPAHMKWHFIRTSSNDDFV